MRRRNLRILLFVLIALTVIMGIISMGIYYKYKEREVWADNLKENYDLKNKELEKKTKEFETNFDTMEDSYYEEKVTQLLGQEQLVEMAKELWKYSITVNGQPLKEDFTYPDSKDVTITLIETKPIIKSLPKRIINLGSIVSGDKLDKFYDHIIIDTTVPYEKSVKDYGDAVKVYYTFKKVPSGTIISLKLSGILMERLKFINDMPEVIIK